MPQGVVNPQLSRQATGGSNMLNTLRALVSLLPGAFPPEAGRGSSLRPETEAPLNEPSLQDVPLILMLGGLMGRGRGAEVFGDDVISALRRALRTEAVARKEARRVEEVGEEGLSELERFFRQRGPETVRARAPERVPFGERAQTELSAARAAGKLPVDVVVPDYTALRRIEKGTFNEGDIAAFRRGAESGDAPVLRVGDPVRVESFDEPVSTVEYFVVPYESEQFAVVQLRDGIIMPFSRSGKIGAIANILSIHDGRGAAIARAQSDAIRTAEALRPLLSGQTRPLGLMPSVRPSADRRSANTDFDFE